MSRSTPLRAPSGLAPWALLCLFAAACGGPATTDTPAAEMAMGSAASPSASGTEIPAGDPVPTLRLSGEGQHDGVWAFTIATDMTLTMETAPYQPMRGHVHVYVDGVEKQMIAEKRFELRDLTPGTHQIGVALADTNHRDLLRGGTKIADSLEVVVPAGD